MKNTNKYKLTYFEKDDFTSAVEEMQRWETIDVQLNALFKILGNGVLNGWEFYISSGFSITISPGKAHVNFVAVETTENTTLSNLHRSATNYIYAILNEDSYWTKSVNFSYFLNLQNNSEYLYLGKVVTNAEGVESVDVDDRATISFLGLINQAVENHKHDGSEGNPQPVDLSSEVRGVLNQNNLPEIDASLVQAGVLDEERIPKIDHETGLTNAGTLTHSQLDAFIENLSNNNKLIGEMAISNMLQLVLSLKHIYPGIDDYFLNSISYIPGISPDAYVDWENTTANVDTKTYAEGGTHTITGTSVEEFRDYTKIWDKKSHFQNSNNNNIYIDHNTFSLSATNDVLDLDDFSNITDWNIQTENLSTLTSGVLVDTGVFKNGNSSLKVSISGDEIDLTLFLKKEFNPQDWSAYKYLKFYIRTESVQHGDIIFYIKDAVEGAQNSYQIILPKNAPTINEETLDNGWEEVIFDISGFERSNINNIGFYVSTQNGWDTSKPFDFNIDAMTLDKGNLYERSGYLRAVFGNGLAYGFKNVEWDSILPSGTALKSRTRVSNTLNDLNSSTWSDYSSVSGYDIVLPSDELYKYIEIELFLESSDDLKFSPYVNSFSLKYNASDVDGNITFDTQEDWESGNSFNMDLTSEPGTIKTNIENLNNLYYGSESKMVQLDENKDELFNIKGTYLPRSTNQVLNNEPSGLGLITGLSKGDNDSIWLSDADNDRIIEIDSNGNLISGFYGSFLTEPLDVYEEAVETEQTEQTIEAVTTEEIIASNNSDLTVLHTIYNSEKGILYVVFNEDLENIYSSNAKLDISKFSVKIGSQIFRFSNSEFELLGVDEQKYNNWSTLLLNTEIVPDLKKFKFQSHVLKITLLGADKTFFNSFINIEDPSVAIVSPYSNQIIKNNTKIKLSFRNFVLGNEENGGNKIKLTIDDYYVEEHYSGNISMPPLNDGIHTLKIELYNGNTRYTNAEATAEVKFVKDNDVTYPVLSIVTPNANQTYSSSPISVEFESLNFPVVPSGQHVKWSIDGGSEISHYSNENILIEDLDNGIHTLRMYFADKNGNNFNYSNGDISVKFAVGLNLNAIAKLYIKNNAIENSNKDKTNKDGIFNIDISNILFKNIYSPIDIQIGINSDNPPSILVSKLRSPSSVDYLGEEDAYLELTSRINNFLEDETYNIDENFINAKFSSFRSDDLVYSSKFVDGFSIVNLDKDGEMIYSSNQAKFANNKEEAKELLGGAKEIGAFELLISDSVNKKALITTVDMLNEKSVDYWEYVSDRYIVDSDTAKKEMITIDVNNGSVSDNVLYLRQGNMIRFLNNSSSPISIYSGTTDYDIFYQDPDLTKYGQEFYSETINPGETWSVTLSNIGEIDWFVYPTILTGTIHVTPNKTSSNDQFYILESDNLESPFTSRLIKVDSWGNVLWSFGEGFLVKPRDVRAVKNNKVLIST
jgi:hypothetical protein